MKGAFSTRVLPGSTEWDNTLAQIIRALGGWNITKTATAAINFPSIAAQARASSTLAVKGARAGDVVALSPSSSAAGIVYSADVTADDTVTIYAHNYSAAGIDPAPTNFRVIVFQGA